MRTDLLRILTSAVVLFQFVMAGSCTGRPGKPGEKPVQASADAEPVAVRLVKLVSPEENATFKLHAEIKVVLELNDRDKAPDSVLIAFDGNRVSTLKSAPWELSLPGAINGTTGRKSVKVTAFRGSKAQNPIARFITVYSDIVPRRYGYRVVHSYPHDPEAFTQGLVYDKGVFFEGTGQKTGSSLREVELQTGKVLRQHNLDPSLFGEGIALYRDRIYQVTWENKIGFIYDKSSFGLITKFYYQTQGWGLTTAGDRLVMSDGSNSLVYYEPELFTAVSRIEVYDNEKKVESLNELEYIDGEIWANIWMSDLIARIDPASGSVLGYIDLKGLLPGSERTQQTDVLNGIAWDPENKRIFVTGKNWPKLFEIRLTE